MIRFGPHAPNWVANSPANTLFMPFNIINMNGRIYDPMIGRMMSPDNYVHDGMGTQGYNRYSYAHNNPLKYTDPDGENPVLIGMAIGAGVYTAMHLIQNKGSFKNWDWGGFVGAVVGGAVGGAIAPALSAAHIGGFYAGAITGAGSGFASGVATGVFNGVENGNFNLGNTLLNAGKSAFMGAIIGGTIGGLDAAIKGQNFWNGRSNISQEMFQDATGTLAPKDGQYSSAENTTRMNEVNSLDANNTVDGTTDGIPQTRSVKLNRGFEGDLTVKGFATLRPSESSYYFNVDGKNVLTLTKSGRFEFPVPSGNHTLSWGITGRAITEQQIVQMGGNNIFQDSIVRSNSFTTIFGQWRSWTGFLWFR